MCDRVRLRNVEQFMSLCNFFAAVIHLGSIDSLQNITITVYKKILFHSKDSQISVTLAKSCAMCNFKQYLTVKINYFVKS